MRPTLPCAQRMAVELVDASPRRRVITQPVPMSFERISIDADRMQGLPCIRGTPVTASAIVGQLAAGRSVDEVLEHYPQLDHADVLGALEYAAAATREREIPLTPAG